MKKTKCDCFSFGLPKLPEKQENTALEADIKRLAKLAKEKRCYPKINWRKVRRKNSL